jgi:hypothetical protein
MVMIPTRGKWGRSKEKPREFLALPLHYKKVAKFVIKAGLPGPPLRAPPTLFGNF